MRKRRKQVTEQLSIRLPIDLSDIVHKMAEDDCKSVNQVINELIEKALEKGE